MCGCQEGKGTGNMTGTDVAGQMQGEIEKIGRQGYLRKVRSAARKALAQMPDDEVTEKLDAVSKRYITQVSALVESGLKAMDWGETELARFANDLAWAKLVLSVSGTIIDLDNGGGGGGPTCVTQCASQYEQCVKENDCDTGGWLCLCCIPCSLQYMGCGWKCITAGGGFGISIA